RSSLRGRQISRLVSCVQPLFFGHDLCPDRLSLPVPPIPGGWSWDRTAARWRCTRPHHALASWTRWRHTAYDRLRPASRTGASSSVRFSVHRRPCCAPTPCCAPIQGLDIIFPENTEVICVPFLISNDMALRSWLERLILQEVTSTDHGHAVRTCVYSTHLG